jgi:hypothetical protein
MMSVTPLTRPVQRDLPAPCGDCVFWQGIRGTSDARRKLEWAETVEDRFGAYGRVLWEGDRFLGVLQYGPASAFPRAQVLPAGPADSRAALITCLIVAGDDPVGTCERLLLEALADLKARGFAAVEAFAIDDPDTPREHRVAGHHTLLDAGVLGDLGFAPVRTQGPVSLMRLPLGGIIETPQSAVAAQARKLISRLLSPAENPSPA